MHATQSMSQLASEKFKFYNCIGFSVVVSRLRELETDDINAIDILTYISSMPRTASCWKIKQQHPLNLVFVSLVWFQKNILESLKKNICFYLLMDCRKNICHRTLKTVRLWQEITNEWCFN